MQPTELPLLHFGSVRAERVARALQLVPWAGMLLSLGYLWWAERGHFGSVAVAWVLAKGASPAWQNAKPSRMLAASSWVSMAIGPVLLVWSLVLASRVAWMGLAFCCNGLGDWLDFKGQRRGVRSNWRIVTGALGIASMGIWLWLELQRAG